MLVLESGSRFRSNCRRDLRHLLLDLTYSSCAAEKPRRVNYATRFRHTLVSIRTSFRRAESPRRE